MLPDDAVDAKNVHVFKPGDWKSIWRGDPLKISKIDKAYPAQEIQIYKQYSGKYHISSFYS